MTTPFTHEMTLAVLKQIKSPRARAAFLLALQTGLKYSVILKLTYEDVYFPNGVFVDVLAIRPRRATKRHPYTRYHLSHWVRTALHTYCVAHTVSSEGRFLFARRPQRNVPVTARHLLRQISDGLHAALPDADLEPTCAQKVYRERMLAALDGDKYLWRVACGLRLPKDGPQWKSIHEPRIFGAQEKLLHTFTQEDFWMFWSSLDGGMRRKESCS